MGLGAWWTSMRARYDALVAEYGWAAIGTYFGLFFLTWFGVWVAISAGWSTTGATATAGTVGGAYVVTKLTQPVRIGLTLVLTPLVVRVHRAVQHRALPPG